MENIFNKLEELNQQQSMIQFYLDQSTSEEAKQEWKGKLEKNQADIQNIYNAIDYSIS